jgi:hypothetical protein
MSMSFIGLSYDVAEPAKVAEFWAQALGRAVRDGASEEFAAVSADASDDLAASAPSLMFHKVPEGKTVKNRLHVDFGTTGLAAETERPLGLGATRLGDVTEDGRIRWTTLADPEGNEFDLVDRG